LACVNVDDNPTHPTPFHVTHGEEMLIGISISHDADRIAQGENRVYLLAFTENPPILNDVTIIDSFRDGFLMHTRCSFGGVSVPDLTVKLRHRVSGP
jgi:hypothetical protein